LTLYISKEISAMGVPSFNAEASIYKSTRSYRMMSSITSGTSDTSVSIAALKICTVWGGGPENRSCIDIDTGGGGVGGFGSGLGGGGGGGRGTITTCKLIGFDIFCDLFGCFGIPDVECITVPISPSGGEF
jgi:hypothetical protein